MITDEQVRTVLKVFYPRAYAPCDEEIELMRKALVAYEQSKWVKFDVDDELTHPRDRQICNVRYHTGQITTDKWSDYHRFWVYASFPKRVTHWQPLPEFKE